jgi:ParB-like chromosome segregation protein Spo0J
LVWQIFFSFYNGELFRILVTYDRDATHGLTAEDMVQAISTKYGTATRPAGEISFPTKELYRSTQKVIARWEDSQYFALVMFSKRLDVQADAAIAKSIKLEGQEDPQKELDRQKKETDDLEAARQKNQKIFRP